MTYEQAMQKKVVGDWKIVARICGETRDNAQIIASRPESKKYKKIMDALVAVVEAREKLFGDFHSKF